MKKLLLLFVCTMALAWSTQAVADIPTNVDFHAKWSGTSGSGTWSILKNIYNYDDPCWPDYLNAFVDNTFVEDHTKFIFVEVEWMSQMNKPAAAPDLRLSVGGTIVPLTSVTATEFDMGWTWKWQVTPQPANETILFPDDSFWKLGQITDPQLPNYYGIESVEVGTYCIPEPATLALLGLGALAMVRRRK